jgi:pimeloyl-ACP methyl ester carboxylesterase
MGPAQARAQLERIAAAEWADPAVEPAYGTRWWIGDERAGIAVVLLHGLTNCPPQFARLAPQLHERGHAVIVPRMPYHGYRDRMSEAIANLRAADLEMAALRAIAAAAQCGERIVVAGISVGATLAGWLAARTGIDAGIAIAPFCGLHSVPGSVNDGLGAALRAAPNRFAWWDPRKKEAQQPPHGYPRFSTRSLGESLRISTELDAARRGPHARRVVLALNENEPVVNNAHARRRFEPLRALGIELEEIVLQGMPPIHDLIEPQIPQEQTELVYPVVIDLIERSSR